MIHRSDGSNHADSEKAVTRGLRICFLAIALFLTAHHGNAMSQDAASTPAPESPVALPSLLFTPAITGEEGRFRATLEPGESVTFSAVLANNGEIPFRFVSYAADAFSARNGGFALRELESEPTGPTTWLDYPTETYEFDPGEGVERAFAIAVPEGTPPGEYVTGIAMQTADPFTQDEGGMFQFEQINRTVLGIAIIVPGERSPILETGTPEMVVEGGIPGVLIPIANTGNSRTEPNGQIDIRNSSGDIVLTGPIQLGPIYGGHATEIHIGLPAPLAPGEYSVDLRLSDPDHGLTLEASALPMTVTETEDETIASSPVTISSATLTPLPDARNVQLALIEATIENLAEPIGNAQLTVVVSLDGQEVERFALSQSLSLPNGATSVSGRYLPLTGWTSGDWRFELVLETVGSGGVATVVDRHTFDEVIEIP